MKQEIRKAETCKECHRITYNAEYSITCDACGKKLERELKDGERQYLEMTIFPADHSLETEELDFCNWEHLVRWLKQLGNTRKPFGFMTFPYLHPQDLDAFLELAR